MAGEQASGSQDFEASQHNGAGLKHLAKRSGDAYLDYINHTPLLSAEQEVALAKNIEAGLVAENTLRQAESQDQALDIGLRRDLQTVALEGRQAKNNLLEANLRLVVWMANRYRSRYMDFFDLIQVGNLGLIDAAHRFDHTLGFKFSTYASFAIRSHMISAIAKSKKEAEPARNRRTISLDSPIGDEENARLADFIVDTDAVGQEVYLATRSHMRRDVARALGTLSPKMRQAIVLRFGLDGKGELSTRQIAELRGVTREGIVQLIGKAIEKLRDQGHLRSYLAD